MHLNVFSIGTGPDNGYWVNYEWMNEWHFNVVMNWKEFLVFNVKPLLSN